MAPKRRTSTPTTAQRNQQATISFGKQGPNRVTKTALAQRESKTSRKIHNLVDIVSSRDITEPTTAEAAIQQQARGEVDEIKPTEVKIWSRGKQNDDEDQARRITDAQIKKYWRNKEAERKAPRVHQQGLDVTEKILREFDMSGQYGPCIGIARLKRWRRASTLGLSPPIEVLAVLLKDADKDNSRLQRAHVDELMSSRFIET